MAEIKNLGALAAVSRSELNEIEEQLEECKVYREFLDRVTPHDWFQEVRSMSGCCTQPVHAFAMHQHPLD